MGTKGGLWANLRACGIRLTAAGVADTDKDTIITLINPNKKAVAYTLTLWNEKGEISATDSGTIPANGTVYQSIQKLTAVFTGSVEILADLPMLGISTTYTVDTEKKRLNGSSVPMKLAAN